MGRRGGCRGWGVGELHKIDRAREPHCSHRVGCLCARKEQLLTDSCVIHVFPWLFAAGRACPAPTKGCHRIRLGRSCMVDCWAGWAGQHKKTSLHS